jgi:hypothetical protein
MKRNVPRAQIIALLHDEHGIEFSTIARAFDVSRQRVYQIYHTGKGTLPADFESETDEAEDVDVRLSIKQGTKVRNRHIGTVEVVSEYKEKGEQFNGEWWPYVTLVTVEGAPRQIGKSSSFWGWLTSKDWEVIE